MELFVVPTIGCKLLYGFVIVRIDRRELVWINVTSNPTTEWIARQITEAFPWDGAPGYIIRDRDRIYGAVVTRRWRAMGIRDRPTAPASPWQNGFAEQLIGSIRRECVDHIIVLGEPHLRGILRTYADYCNGVRTHRSLDKDAPVFRPVQRTGMISSRAILADFTTTTPVFWFSVHTGWPWRGRRPDRCPTRACRSRLSLQECQAGGRSRRGPRRYRKIRGFPLFAYLDDAVNSPFRSHRGAPRNDATRKSTMTRTFALRCRRLG